MENNLKKEHIYTHTHIYIYIKLNHFAVHLRLLQHYTFLLKKFLCTYRKGNNKDNKIMCKI